MTPTSELASLLRLAAEKSPETFWIDDDDVFERTDGCIPPINLADLDCSSEWTNFTLDHMDAIAGAVGMWFDLTHNAINAGDIYMARYGERGSWQPIGETPWADSLRTASIAALCAILRYRYGEANHA